MDNLGFVINATLQNKKCTILLDYMILTFS